MDIVWLIALFAVACFWLILFLINLRNVGSMKRLWPLALNVFAWLLFGLWELHVVLGHSFLRDWPFPWPPVLLFTFLLSLKRV